MTFVDGGDVWLLGSGFLTDCFLTGGSWFLSSVFVVASRPEVSGGGCVFKLFFLQLCVAHFSEVVVRGTLPWIILDVVCACPSTQYVGGRWWPPPELFPCRFVCGGLLPVVARGVPIINAAAISAIPKILGCLSLFFAGFPC